VKVSNSDFWILAGIFSVIGTLGVHEGNELHPAFYSQTVILFGGLGYLAYKALYLDHRSGHVELSSDKANSETQHSESP